MKVTHFYACKGGVGCSTVAALYASLLPGDVVLVDASGNHDHAVLVGADIGRTNSGRSLTLLAGSWLDLGPKLRSAGKADHVVVDWGLERPYNLRGDSVFVVTTNRYPALRRTLDGVRLRRPADGVVLVFDSTGAIGSQDCQQTLGIPVVATVRHDTSIARAIDAGLLIGRAANSQTNDLRALIREEVAA